VNQLQTHGIILTRTDFGEADRIITLLTPDQGKLRLMAKGVRRVKSKLAGGIELFSVSHITYMPGRGEIGTLVSTRLLRHYGRIVADINRTMLGYELIKQLHRATEDAPEAEYYELLEEAFAALDSADIGAELIQLWFSAQLLKLAGHTPNLQTDSAGAKLEAASRYDFSLDDTAFQKRPEGIFGADEIKFLRLTFGGNQPAVLAKVAGAAELTGAAGRLVALLARQYLRS